MEIDKISKFSAEIMSYKLTWDEELGETIEFVEYYMDGISLRKILTIENSSGNFVEEYIGLSPGDFYHPSTHFNGRAIEGLEEENGTRIILVCSHCGEPTCHDVVCEIDVSEEYVIWKNFMTPSNVDSFRKLKGGPFVFDRREYEKVILVGN